MKPSRAKWKKWPPQISQLRLLKPEPLKEVLLRRSTERQASSPVRRRVSKHHPTENPASPPVPIQLKTHRLHRSPPPPSPAHQPLSSKFAVANSTSSSITPEKSSSLVGCSALATANISSTESSVGCATFRNSSWALASAPSPTRSLSKGASGRFSPAVRLTDGPSSKKLQA